MHALGLRKYWANFAIHLKQAMYVPVRPVAQAIISGSRLFFLFLAYTYAYQFVGSPGIPLESALAALAMYNLLLPLNLRGVFGIITDNIESGQFEVKLLHPWNFLVAVAVGRFGYASTLVASNVVVAVVLYGLFSPGLPQFSFLALGYGLAVLALGVVLSGLLYTLIALPALWINDAEPLYYILDKSMLILGGAYVPVALYPDWLRAIADYTPMGASVFGSRIFDAGFVSAAPAYLAVQALWIVVTWGAVTYVFWLAKRHMTVNGG